MQGDRERCLATGMDDYLAKPIKLDELRNALARWVSTPPDVVVSGEAATNSHDGRPNPRDL